MGEKFDWGEHQVSDDKITLAGYDSHAGLEAAQNYCSLIARSHYENFLISNRFTPADKRQHIENIYAFCRYGDDLGDDAPFSNEIRWRLLDEWEADLARSFSGSDTGAGGAVGENWSGTPRHPILTAVAHTAKECDIPHEPFWKLIQAFKMDQKKSRYETWDELRDYCVHSADPVGHLFLYVYGHDEQSMRDLADFTCTALQLANHWQDVKRDLEQGRCYIPEEDMIRFQYSEQDLQNQVVDERWKALMEFQVKRSQEWFDEGRKLWEHIDPRLAVDLQMFTMGGEAVLASIKRQSYDTWSRRPTIGRFKQLRMLMRVRRLWKAAQRKARA